MEREAQVYSNRCIVCLSCAEEWDGDTNEKRVDTENFKWLKDLKDNNALYECKTCKKITKSFIYWFDATTGSDLTTEEVKDLKTIESAPIKELPLYMDHPLFKKIVEQRLKES